MKTRGYESRASRSWPGPLNVGSWVPAYHGRHRSSIRLAPAVSQFGFGRSPHPKDGLRVAFFGCSSVLPLLFRQAAVHGLEGRGHTTICRWGLSRPAVDSARRLAGIFDQFGDIRHVKISRIGSKSPNNVAGITRESPSARRSVWPVPRQIPVVPWR